MIRIPEGMARVVCLEPADEDAAIGSLRLDVTLETPMGEREIRVTGRQFRDNGWVGALQDERLVAGQGSIAGEFR